MGVVHPLVSGGLVLCYRQWALVVLYPAGSGRGRRKGEVHDHEL